MDSLESFIILKYGSVQDAYDRWALTLNVPPDELGPLNDFFKPFSDGILRQLMLRTYDNRTR